MPALQSRLRSDAYHVFHFIGHGGFDTKADEGVLVFEDERGDSYLAGADRIGTLLHDHRSLRLAVLNSCEGARNSRTDPFAGVATELIRQAVPAVVAMQFEITDSAAIIFSDSENKDTTISRPLRSNKTTTPTSAAARSISSLTVVLRTPLCRSHTGSCRHTPNRCRTPWPTASSGC